MTRRRQRPLEPWERFLASSEAGLAESPFDNRLDAGGDWVRVQCPHCFETLEILLDAETQGRLIQDCEVCCHPWELAVERQRDGGRKVEVRSLD